MGNVIPFDGTVISGEAMVNQASLTGESEPVRRGEGTSVFAGTVVEEGEIVFKVKRAGGSSKYDKIVRMIEESEKLKSGLESKADILQISLCHIPLVELHLHICLHAILPRHYQSLWLTSHVP